MEETFIIKGPISGVITELDPNNVVNISTQSSVYNPDDEKANRDASNIDPFIEQWQAKLALPSPTESSFRVGKIVTDTANSTVTMQTNGAINANSLTVNGNTYLSNSDSVFTFTPVPEGLLRQLVIFGLPIAPYFYMVEGSAATEAEYPTTVPPDAVIINEIIASNIGATQKAPDTSGLKTKAEDNWTEILVKSQVPRAITANNQSAHFIIRKTSGFSAINLTGIIVKGTETWEGKRFHIFNDTDADITFAYSDTVPTAPSGYFYNYYDEESKYGALVIKPRNTGVLAFYNGALIPEKYSAEVGGAGIQTIEAGVNATIDNSVPTRPIVTANFSNGFVNFKLENGVLTIGGSGSGGEVIVPNVNIQFIDGELFLTDVVGMDIDVIDGELIITNYQGASAELVDGELILN